MKTDLSVIAYFKTSFGRIGIVDQEGALIRVLLEPDQPPAGVSPGETELIQRAFCQIRGFLRGERMSFDLPLNPAGTPFQRSVWSYLQQIPYGATRTYGGVALALGKPGAARAVGNACNCNPLPILIPCHRVLGSRGELSGYRGGVEMKKKLLQLEACL